MTVVQCPRCRDEVTVPAKASPRALVRCPLCLEEYTLREALAELPPTLIVIDGSVADEDAELVGAGVASAHAGGGYELSGGGFPSAAVLDSSAPAEAAVVPAKLKGKLRPKKKQASAIVEMTKVVVGGVVGLTMGLGVLWWVFGKDPLDLGPKISPHAPWAVPAKFHAKPKANDKTAENGGGPLVAQNNAPKSNGGKPAPVTPAPPARPSR